MAGQTRSAHCRSHVPVRMLLLFLERLDLKARQLLVILHSVECMLSLITWLQISSQMTTTFVGLTIHPFEPKRHERCVLRKDARLIAEALTIKQLQLGFSKAQNLPWLVASQNGFLEGISKIASGIQVPFNSIQKKKSSKNIWHTCPRIPPFRWNTWWHPVFSEIGEDVFEDSWGARWSGACLMKTSRFQQLRLQCDWPTTIHDHIQWLFGEMPRSTGPKCFRSELFAWARSSEMNRNLQFLKLGMPFSFFASIISHHIPLVLFFPSFLDKNYITQQFSRFPPPQKRWVASPITTGFGGWLPVWLGQPNLWASWLHEGGQFCWTAQSVKDHWIENREESGCNFWEVVSFCFWKKTKRHWINDCYGDCIEMNEFSSHDFTWHFISLQWLWYQT